MSQARKTFAPNQLPMGIRKLSDNSLASAIMGILNFTEDSFSGDGLLSTTSFTKSISALLRQAESFLQDGADWLDLGAESTRPGAEPLALEQERARLLPALEALLVEFPHALISIDTRKAELAHEAFSCGARMLNDVSGARREQLWSSLAPYGSFSPTATSGWVVLMHNARAKFQVGTAQSGGDSWQPHDALLSEPPSVLSRLAELASWCEQAGVAREKIILDAGLGFAKSFAQNLSLLGGWSRVSALGYPSLMGCSRKSFLGKLLAADSLVSESLDSDSLISDSLADAATPAARPAHSERLEGSRLEGSLAACALAITGGARILRVHDVAATHRFVRAFCAMRAAAT